MRFDSSPCPQLPELNCSVACWRATARLQGLGLSHYQSCSQHHSYFWNHCWNSTNRRPMNTLRNQAYDAPRIDVASEGTANWGTSESHARPFGQGMRKVDKAMAGRVTSTLEAAEPERGRNSKVHPIPRVRKVAVIGAGAAGLVAARELRREGHDVVVYEQNGQVGGVWVYNPEVENDLLGVLPDRSRIHGSMYESLRTNLPRELMGFLDFPFLPIEGRDTRRFPGHKEVNLYLEDFAKEFDILRLVRFDTEVENVSLKKEDNRTLQNNVADVSVGNFYLDAGTYRGTSKHDSSPTLAEQLAWPNFDSQAPEQWEGSQAPCLDGEIRGLEISSSKWIIRSRKRRWINHSNEQLEVGGVVEDVFDAVVVCIGHYSEPKIASIPGIELWSGRVMHSHNYRLPSLFQGQVVVVIGSAASGEDISREVATVAKEVHICARAWSPGLDLARPDNEQANLWRHPMIACISKEGAVRFEDGSEVYADSILHCTGYKYSFPFLDAQGLVSVEDNRVGPLFQHMFPPALAPQLSFVGLPYKVVPFPLFELQSKWIAQVLSGKLSLPSPEQMMRAVDNFYSSLEAYGYPKHYTHNIDPYQYAYVYWLAAVCGCEVDPWREEMYAAGREGKRLYPNTYRDVWIDQHLMNEVYSHLLQFQSSRARAAGFMDLSSIV